MTLRIVLAGLHLLALGIGLGAVWVRGRSLGQRPLDLGAVHRAFTADSWWGVAAVVWLASGLWRMLGAMEKSTSYYTRNVLFMTKMSLFLLILVLELWPMITLMRWRRQVARAGDAWHTDAGAAARIARISYAEAGLLVVMVFLAVSMARGLGAR